jgi:hypothetical protein
MEREFMQTKEALRECEDELIMLKRSREKLEIEKHGQTEDMRDLFAQSDEMNS